ncbi:MAG: extracellular solute-binding protein [bacterium]|nr:extracellular solute-binding protein [bacterium]
MKRKTLTAAMLTTALMASLLGGCAKSDSTSGQTEATQATQAAQTAGTSAASTTAENVTAQEQGNTEWSGTLKLYGPGLFSSVGLDGNVDIITGVKKPGYQVVIDRWKELYPNVDLVIEPIPWDNWKAALQTAAISGDVDILMHGASLGPVVEPLQPYLDKDPDYESKVTMMTLRRNAELAPLNEVVPFGVTVTLNPVMVVINKTIFEDYGVAIPDYKTWTLDDMMEAAKATTGTDPKTGKETYGISPIKLSNAYKNYIWAARAKNNEIFEWGDSIKNSKMNFISDGTAEVLNYLTAFKDYTSPDYVEGLDLAAAYTEDNPIAMIITEDSYNVYNTLKENGLDDQYMLATLPVIEDGPYKGITSSHFGDWHMSICKNSTQKDLAWEFLKFMTTDQVVQQWILDTYSIPANIEANNRLEEYMSADFADAMIHAINTCPPDFSCSENECYDSGNFGTFMNDLATVLGEMYQGNMDAQQAMEYVQENVDNYLSTLH